MKAFDTKLFKRILIYTKPYQWLFRGVIIWAIGLSVFAALRPYLLKKTVDDYIQTQDKEGLLVYILLMGFILLMEVLSQFYFVYWANWLGQDIVRDIRVKLFQHMLRFKMKYYDNSPVGQLVTRSVSDIEAIARIFSQGLFMIISDLMKMVAVIIVMFFMNWKLSWIAILAMPILIYATRIFQLKMKVAFEEVRTQVANLNTFVQERVTGMKIVQLFSREQIEYEKFKEINDKHNKAWIKTVWYNSIFFPIADLVTYLTLALVIYFGGLSLVEGDTTTSFGDLFTYTMLIGMLFNPLRQIADKFNEMQMGMIAANRVFHILDIEEQVQQEGTENAPHFEGKLSFENVHFSYIEGEEIIKGINLEVNPGETIAIVGSTGAENQRLSIY